MGSPSQWRERLRSLRRIDTKSGMKRQISADAAARERQRRSRAI